MSLSKIIQADDSAPKFGTEVFHYSSPIRRMYANLRLHYKYFLRGLKLLNEHFRDMSEYVERED